jgi:hypothetical protein
MRREDYPLPLSGRFACRSLPDTVPASPRSWCPLWARDLMEAPRSRQGLWSPGPPIRALCTETGGSPTFPSYPCADMLRSQTPVGSCALAIPHPGLLPSGACKPSALTAIPLRLSCGPRLSIFRGSLTRPASSLPPASYAHCWAGTWSSLLTCWRGVRQVGLEPTGSHPLGNINQFHRISPTPKVSGLPWREHALVRLGMTLRRRVTYRHSHRLSQALGLFLRQCLGARGVLHPSPPWFQNTRALRMRNAPPIRVQGRWWCAYAWLPGRIRKAHQQNTTQR